MSKTKASLQLDTMPGQTIKQQLPGLSVWGWKCAYSINFAWIGLPPPSNKYPSPHMKHPRPLGHNIKQSPLPTYAPHYFLKYRASDWSRKKKSNFAGFLETKSRKNQPISREFRGNFRGKLGWKKIGKKTAAFVVIFSANFANHSPLNGKLNKLPHD